MANTIIYNDMHGNMVYTNVLANLPAFVGWRIRARTYFIQ